MADHDWGSLITSLMADKVREERRRMAESQRAARPAQSEEDIRRQKRKVALDQA